MKSESGIAVLFGILAIATSVILVFNTVIWLRYVFAIFWFGTGVLGIYLAVKK